MWWTFHHLFISCSSALLMWDWQSRFCRQHVIKIVISLWISLHLNFGPGSIFSTVSSCDFLKSPAFIWSSFEERGLTILVVPFPFRIFCDCYSLKLCLLEMAQEPQIFLGKELFPADGCGWPIFMVLRKLWLGEVLSLGTESAESLPQFLDDKTVLCDCRVGSS